ncbi:hypothetical protein NPD1_2085 [Clostridium botulinum]|nr:hypothetical protein [Clostridium botulinum]APH23855.1 hypothetical protein NPD1_2085 [Clostridium botulinum]
MENKDINLYDIFINYSYSELKDLFKNAKTKEEQDFYMTLSNLVLQKEQAKVIGKYHADLYNFRRSKWSR